VSRFRFVEDHRDVYGVKRLCRVLGVSRSGYYGWRSRGPSRHAVRDGELTALIGRVHARSRGTYGAPRIHAELTRSGERCSRRRVARLMRAAGIAGARSRRSRPGVRAGVAEVPDLVRRDFRPARRDAVWAADITRIDTAEGPVQLAVVIDLSSRRIVGWAMGPAPSSDLVLDAVLMAVVRRRPTRRLVHHSDRGSAYTSLAFSRRLAELGIAQSFGSKGDAYDNAPVEAFFSTLKRELAWIHTGRRWPSRDMLRSVLFEYIEGFFNTSRIQAGLGYLSPAEYERLPSVA
jgi:transposase InsO family protein